MKNLFDEFNPVSSKQWKQKIQYELDGKDYNETLVWNSPENIKVKPFYHQDEFEGSFHKINKKNIFQICQNIYVFNIEKSNLTAIQSIKNGAESICFTVDDDKIHIQKLLENIDLEKVAIFFKFSFLSVAFIKKIEEFVRGKNVNIYCNLDPIGQLAKEGNWFSAVEKNNFDSLNLIATAETKLSILSVNGSLYQNAGANIVQQIAYSLAHANEYFNRIKSICQPIVFEISVGTNYFFEIAKLRALRLLFNLIAAEYNHQLDCQIFATPTKRNKTIYESNINLYRTSTECLSAILGGADTIANLPFDFLYKKTNFKSEKIALNQLLFLKNESQFDQSINPAEGSFYIESLTNQLAEKALVLFKEIEANGGFLEQLNAGTIQKKIQESAKKEQDLFDSESEILVGTNKFTNPNEILKDSLELYPFSKIKVRKTLISPIIEKRLAEKMEKERLEGL